MTVQNVTQSRVLKYLFAIGLQMNDGIIPFQNPIKELIKAIEGAVTKCTR
jgi:hypothetical protein